MPLTVRTTSETTPHLGFLCRPFGTCLGGGLRILGTWETPHPRHRRADRSGVSPATREKDGGGGFVPGSRCRPGERRAGATRSSRTRGLPTPDAPAPRQSEEGPGRDVVGTLPSSVCRVVSVVMVCLKVLFDLFERDHLFNQTPAHTDRDREGPPKVLHWTVKLFRDGVSQCLQEEIYSSRGTKVFIFKIF